MAQKLGILNQWLFGAWADRAAINRNADDLSTVETNVSALQTMVQRQAREITQLRAMFLGLVEVLHDKVALDEAEVERAVQAAWAELTAPPPEPPPRIDPYRDATAPEPSDEDIAAAKARFAAAQDHHFSKRFGEAREIYQEIVDRYGGTKQAALARQQLENLRNA